MSYLRQSIGEYPPEWENGQIQQAAKERANGKCETCGRTTQHMSCHHIDHNRSNNHPDNIVYLCNRCHLDCHRWSWVPGEMLPLAWHGQNMPRWIQARRLAYIEHPQKPLWKDTLK